MVGRLKVERRYDIPLSVPDLRGREREYLTRCVDENWVSTAGPFVDQVEDGLAAISDQDHAVATCTGTAALHLALLAVGVKAGDLVIVPDWTFGATANAVYHAGATPLLVDVQSTCWTLDPARVEDVLNTRAVAAVIAVDALGHPADMDALGAVCRDHNVPLIEDAAGAIGARYKGRPAGGLADVGIYSFNGNKTITAGGGGAAVTNRDDYATLMAQLAVHRVSDASRAPGGFYRYDVIGFNYRMTNISAALALAQLERLDQMLARKRAIAACYDQGLAGRDDLRPMPRAAWADPNCWMYSVMCGSADDADRLVRHLEQQRVQARIFWQALSSQTAYDSAPRDIGGVAQAIGARTVALPCSSNLTEDQQHYVLGLLREWQGNPVAELAQAS